MGKREEAEVAAEKARSFAMENWYGEAKTWMRRAMELCPDIEYGLYKLVVYETLYYGCEMKYPNWGIDWYAVVHLHPSATDSEVKTHCQNISKRIRDLKVKLSLPGDHLAEQLYFKARCVLCDQTRRLDYDRKRKDSGLIDMCSSKMASSFQEHYLGWKEPVFCSAPDHCHSRKRSNPQSEAVDGHTFLSPDSKKFKPELFDEMPQRPHYRPLDKYCSKVREGMIMGLNSVFANLSEEIGKLDSVESYWSGLDGFMEQLTQLEEMGYDVKKLRERLETLANFASRERLLKEDEEMLESKVKSYKESIADFEHKIVEVKSQIDVVKKERVKAVDAFASAL